MSRPAKLNCLSLPHHLLARLEENEVLRSQVLQLQNCLQEQHLLIDSAKSQQDMQLNRISSPLKMHLSSLAPREESLRSLLTNCVLDIESLSIVPAKVSPHSHLQGVSEERPFHWMIEQSSLKLEEADSLVQQLRQEKNALQSELRGAGSSLKGLQQMLSEQSAELTKTLQTTRIQQNSIRELRSQADTLLALNSELQNEREELFTKLKASKEVGHKVGDYLKLQSQDVLLENHKLLVLSREAAEREAQLIKQASIKQQHIQILSKEILSLKQELRTFQEKFRIIIEKEAQIRSLQGEQRPKERANRMLKENVPERSIPTVSIEHRPLQLKKEVGTISKGRLKGASLAEVLSTSNVSSLS